MSKISIAIADDHTVLRSALKAMLNYYSRFEVIGEASNGLETIDMLENCHPDVLILDLAMPVMSGMECIKEIRYRNIGCRILVLTMYDEEEYVKKVMQAGADGYILKKSADIELINGIEGVYSGKKFIHESLVEKLMENLLCDTEAACDELDPYTLLSIREREVTRFLALGYNNSEIGARLSLSPKTIDTYRSRIMKKLGVCRKSKLVNYAIKYKLVNM
ncbi:MAG: response regulator transcription factor [Pelosinus sp.]|nr:response regulator transcription factor [Pelosinus sp.]